MLRLLFAVALWLAAFSARGEIVLNGFMVARNQPHFSLFSEEQKTNRWITVGESFSGYTAIAFDSQTGILTLENGEVRKELRLQGSAVSDSGSEPKARLRQLKGLELARELARQGDPLISAQLNAYERIVSRLGEAEKAYENAVAQSGQADASKANTGTHSAILFLRNQAAELRSQLEKAAEAAALLPTLEKR